jgi:hypothetical protein
MEIRKFLPTSLNKALGIPRTIAAQLWDYLF